MSTWRRKLPDAGAVNWRVGWSSSATSLAVVLPSAVRGKSWALTPARRLAFAVAVLAALGMVLKALPGFYQSNIELIALALPVHAGVALGLLGAAPSRAT